MYGCKFCALPPPVLAAVPVTVWLWFPVKSDIASLNIVGTFADALGTQAFPAVLSVCHILTPCLWFPVVLVVPLTVWVCDCKLLCPPVFLTELNSVCDVSTPTRVLPVANGTQVPPKNVLGLVGETLV